MARGGRVAGIIAGVALGFASVGFVAQPAVASAEAKQPTPEAVQSWYKVPPTKTKAASSPEASIESLNLLYGVMFEYEGSKLATAVLLVPTQL